MSERNRSSDRATRRQLLGLMGGALAAGLALTLVPGLALAQARPLDAPRAAGTVGERFDGYAVARPGASADIAALVDRVNAERRALYTERARSQNAPVAEIGKIYALEIIKSAPAGTWFLAEDGKWTQK